MLDKIAAILQGRGVVNSDWQNEQREQGRIITLYRQYYDGEHRMKLTAEMKKMMQISDNRLDRYNDNYCQMVVDAMGDRLAVDVIKPAAENDAAGQWADRVMKVNRFDGFQIAVNQAVLRDGETYAVVQYDDVLESAYFAQEDAWDGTKGVLVVWDASHKAVVAGVKVWEETTGYRVNIYYPDSFAQYSADSNDLTLIAEVPTGRAGLVPGVPIIVFSNNRSELSSVIPLQDSLNRTLISMVMSAELSAFSMLFAVGFTPPEGLSPGMIIKAGLTDSQGNAMSVGAEDAAAAAAYLNAMRLDRIEGGSLVELINQANWLIMQIATITATPIPMTMGGDSASGESLKQREVMLMGKVRRAQVQMGNAYEDMMHLCWMMEYLYANARPPEAEGWDTRWKDSAVRNDSDIFAMFKILNDAGYEKEALRVLSQSSLVQYSEQDIDRLMDEKLAQTDATVRASAGNVPGFSNFAPLAI